jgi:hypothetical protein
MSPIRVKVTSTVALAAFTLLMLVTASRAGWKDYRPGNSPGYSHGHGCYCHPFPYNTGSCLYGYPDYVRGRGPLVDLGAASLDQGFRGYGVFGSPGYGLGLEPHSMIDIDRGLFRRRILAPHH